MKLSRHTLPVALVVAIGLAVPVGEIPARAAPAGGTEFQSSLEPGDPQPNWTNTAEVDPTGRKKTSGVTGSPASGIPGNVADRATEVTGSGENPPNETAQRAVDQNISTKWLVFASTGWIRVRLDEPVAVVHYALTSANDAPERDPRSWTLQGSTDGESWTTLDTRSGQEFAERFQTREYRLDNTTTYGYYRLNITAVGSGGTLQLAELQLSDGDTTPPPVTDMRSFVSGGPVNGPTMKPNAGWTGRNALQYSGGQTVDGRGYAYNQVFDVDLGITPDTELSYAIFPELSGQDLDYPSTYAAVDLAFDDGTYLSDLGAVDQYGFGLSPQAQGVSKSLYADQWNLKRSRVGAVAAGKRAVRILVGYDSGTGTGVFNGWVDDIRVTANPARPNRVRPSDYVLTTRGTNSTGGFSRGNNIPATAVPHGFNFWTPMTNAGSTDWLYDYQRANNADNRPTLQAFTVSHEPSPWMGDRQTFQVMPSVAQGVPDANRTARALPFQHGNETARAHYYGVRFDNGLVTEIAPTDHAAMFRFTFPGDRGNLIFDNVNNNGGLTLGDNGEISGYTDVRSGLSNGATRMFVHAVADRPVVASGRLTGGGGANVTGYLGFDTSDSRQVHLRIATSLISVEQARRNLANEIGRNDTFDVVRERAQRLWDDKLRVVEVEGATEDQLVTLYSNLYRLFLYPNSAHENVGTPEAPHWRHAVQSSTSSSIPVGSTPTETGAEVVDGKVYVNNGFWDTYRTTWSAYTLFSPGMAGELVDGFVQQYRDGGWVSRWSAPGYANLMTGTSSDVAFADAYVKGVRNFDAKAAYQAAVRNATVAPPGANPDNTSVGRKGLQTSIFAGYTSSAVSEGVSWALEGYVNDFGIANMATALAADPATPEAERAGYRSDAEYFRNRAQNYVHMFDPDVEFFQGRDAAGRWKSDPDEYDPRVWGHEHDYTETNGWNFAFHVPHDGQGLANLYGGRDALAEKLDEFFATPETARFPGSYNGTIHEMIEARDVRMGMWGFSNQVSHHIPWMYTYAGQPAKTQAKVREVLSRMYLGSEIGQGYAGDEDNGETSAWYLFSALGLYPLQVGSPDYVIGSPLFRKATVHLENGRDIVVNAPDNSAGNVYVQRLRVDGVPYDRTSISHGELADGAVLDFQLGAAPSSWGTGAASVPASLTPPGAPARPLADIAVRGGPAALTDDTSATEATLDGAVTWSVTGTPEKVTHYTLTSGAEPGDPRGWQLAGSYDGRQWTVIDSRADQTFRWRSQTRSFDVERPGRYAHYRLTPAESDTPVALAEVELLANPSPDCTSTVTGRRNGPLTVSSGVVCLTGATIRGPVVVQAGAALYVDGGSIAGPVSASGASAVVLRNVEVGGRVLVTGTAGEVGVERARVGGPVTLTGNAGPLVSATTVGGPLACAANDPAPVGNGLANTVRGPASGQCAGL
ncbi:GH92 family glycosyl hydrolase [Plantactinospora sp. CA-290183]|uniref:GH92 family glycosyl hydrolase n=1 Tax=Plantactinospora sp. CA-290183 TaxID=3240006 RepID=UPI003D8D118A